MKSFLAFILPSITYPLVASAASSTAHVLLYDPGNRPSSYQRKDVAPNTARLIFSERLGLSQFENLEDVEDGIVEEINAYAGVPQQLFGQEQTIRERGFIVIEGVNQPKDVISNIRPFTSLSIADPPSTASGLLQDLIERADYISKLPDSPWRHTYNAEEIAELFSSFVGGEDSWTLKESRGPLTFLSVAELSVIGEKYGSKSNYFTETQAKIQQAFDSLIELAQKENFSLTILFMGARSPKSAKRSESTWGTGRRAQQPEILLSAASTETKSSTSATSTSPAKAQFADSPLRGIIPACFGSLSACQEGTRNCSSHGECVAKFKSEDGTCYTCACTIPEVRTNPDGSKKTTRFGGPACNKKDVVMPFWLFAGFAVVMAGLLSYGIGLLYSIGNEELPSVIGAGVSGPRAK